MQKKVRLSQIAIYVVLLAPISIVVGEDGVSANYLFAILLLSPLGFQRNAFAAAYLLFMVCALLAGLVLFSGFDPYFMSRQLISFSIAAVGVLLLFARLNVRLEEFLVAVVLSAVLYSTYALYMIAQNFTLADILLIKAGLREFVPDWPQRYVVVLLFALFVALERWKHGLSWQLAYIAILTCIFLTFTRSAWIGVAVGTAVYIASGIRKSPASAKNSRTSQISIYCGAAFCLGLLAYALTNNLVSAAFLQIVDNLLDIASTDAKDFDAIGSEGTRLTIWAAILHLIGSSPIFGTGFAGAHLVVEGTGSAHSQYADILLRTGVVGLMFYLYFWGKLLKWYASYHRGVLAGLAALLVFGVFNETTKLSYGALIFFVLLNKAYELQLMKRIALKTRSSPLGAATS